MQCLWQAEYEFTNLITHAAKRDEHLFLGCRFWGKLGWVIKANMRDAGISRKYRATFICMPADGDDLVKMDVIELFQRLAVMP